ncbi:hypothetical protein [uncultured Roseovarius sp.]|uniref:hypothetical protein n=1 Tax=Roseovarius pacificus TaxID=337701 RepID=UPI0025992D33|nr:hypothetical protein [uncultured Roseovarius sp.]
MRIVDSSGLVAGFCSNLARLYPGKARKTLHIATGYVIPQQCVIATLRKRISEGK